MKESENKDISPATETNMLSFIKTHYEKVCQASFAITAHIKDTEAVRQSIRDTAIQLRTYIQNIPDESGVFTYGISEVAEHAKVKTGIICALLDLALAGGLVSKINHQYFISECQKIIAAVSSRLAQSEWGFSSVLAISEANSIEQKSVPAKPFQQKSSQKGMVRIIKDKDAIKDIKDTRSERIVSYVSLNGRVSIQDIHKAIPDTSTKTIQRALNVLIKEGKIKRFGDKRWALYYI